MAQDRFPDAGDDFDQLVLDESFVAGATISEESAEARTRQRAALERRAQARRRTKRPKKRGWGGRARGRRRHDERRAARQAEAWSGQSGWLRRPPPMPPLRSWSLAQWGTTALAAAVVGVVIWLGVGGLSGSSSTHRAPPPAPAPAVRSTTPPAVQAPGR